MTFKNPPSGAGSFAGIATLRQLIGDERCRDVLSVFLTESGMLLEQLKELLAAENSDGAQEIAHKLKGACHSVAATEAALLSQRLQVEAASNDFAAASSSYRKLTQLHEILHEQISRYLQDKGD